MAAPTQHASGTRFEIEPRLRRMHTLYLALKVTGLTVAASVLSDLAMRRSIHLGPPLLWVGFILVIALVCRVRVGWGTAVVFQDSAVVFFRGGSPVDLLQRNSIQAIQTRKNSLTFRYQGDLGRKTKIIGSEGFPKEVWLALCEHAAKYVVPTRKS